MAVLRLLLTTALLLMLAIPATAGATRATPPPHRLLSAREQPPTPIAAAAVARRYWGTVPCNGQVTVLAQQPLAPGMGPTTSAWATWDSPLGANDLAAPTSTYTNCTIALSRLRWPTAASMRADWDMLCLTMIHETGHLLGLPHDDARGSVMAPTFTDLRSVPTVCRTTRPPARTT